MTDTTRPRHLFPLLLGEAIANLIAVAQRSVLALLGIVIGTASVIAMLDVGHNAEIESIRQFRSMGTDLIVAQSFGGREQLSGVPASAIEGIPEVIPDIRRAAPVAMTGLRLGRGEGVQVSLVGATASVAPLIRLRMAEGRFLSPFDTDETFVVVGAQIAASPNMENAPLHPGDRIRMGDYLFTVIGVLADVAYNPLLPFDVNAGAFVPLASLRRVAPEYGGRTILASAREESDPVRAAESLRAHLVALSKDPSVQTQSARQLIEGMQEQARIMAGLLAAVGGISLLVGGVGVMNVMLMNVAERRREIGLRMALGARRSHVRTIFLMEAAMLSLAGGICGTALGVLAAWLYARYSGWVFSPAGFTLPLGAAISLGVGLFFGAYPATTAARLDPIETLRTE